MGDSSRINPISPRGKLGAQLPPPITASNKTNLGSQASIVKTRPNVGLSRSTPRLTNEFSNDDIIPGAHRPVESVTQQPLSPRAAKPDTGSVIGGSSIRPPLARQDTIGWKRSALPTTATPGSQTPSSFSSVSSNPSSSRTASTESEPEQNPALRAEIVSLRNEKENFFKEVRSLREEKHRLLEDIATMRASLEKVTKEFRDRQDEQNATREKVGAVAREVAQLKFMHEELSSGPLNQKFASSSSSSSATTTQQNNGSISPQGKEKAGGGGAGGLLVPQSNLSRVSPRRNPPTPNTTTMDENTGASSVIADKNTPQIRKNGFW